MIYDTLIRGGTVVLGAQGVVEADIAVAGGTIAAILGSGHRVEAAETIEAKGLHVLPGVIDTHVHWGYKGDFREQCQHDSRAAAIGGTTTVHVLHRVEPGGFHALREIAEQTSTVDFFVTPCVYDEASAAQVEEAIEEWGCPSIKFYLAYRNVPDAPPGDDWNELTDGLFAEVLARMAAYDGTLACVHAENGEVVNRAWARVHASGADGLSAWADVHPELGEAEAVLRAGFFAERAGVPLYIVHLSGRAALEALARAAASWSAIYGETCPHYLVHNVESSPPVVKFSPPVRHREDNEALWIALRSGLLKCLGSDNASTRLKAKRGNIFESIRGGPGAGTLLPLVLSEGVHKGRLNLQQAVEVTSANAARIFGLYPRKGAIQVGSDADLLLVDLERRETPSPDLLGTWSDHNLYSDFELKGWPVLTMLRGRVIAREFEVLVEPGYGRFLPRFAKRRAISERSA